MNNDELEAGLRAALARRAAEIPDHAADRLRGRDYRPRGHNWRAAAGATAVVMIAAGGYLAWASATGTSHPPVIAQHADAAIQLDGYQFTLPEGYKATTAPCAPPGPGTPAPGSTQFAAGAGAHGGCLEAVLSTQDHPPAAASPLSIGHHQAFVSAPPPGGTITLYIDISGDSRYRWLVITATNLHQRQVITIAARALTGSRTG